MIDTARPVAPSLPTEITEQILDQIYRTNYDTPTAEDLEFGTLATISQNWKEGVQQRLFGLIVVESLQRIEKLASITGSSLFESTIGIIINLPISLEYTPHLIFLLLKSTSNLHFLSIHIPTTELDVQDKNVLRSTIFLPKLSTIYYNNFSSKISKGSNISPILDSIIASAPNLKFLNLKGISGNDTLGTPFTSNLNNLRALTLDGDTRDLSNFLWAVESFRGLKALEIQYPLYRDQHSVNMISFYEVVGPSLISLEIPNTPPSQLLSNMVALRKLKIGGHLKTSDLSLLPPDLVEISFHYIYDSDIHVDWSKFAKLEVLMISELRQVIPLTSLNSLISLAIEYVYEEDGVSLLLESLKGSLTLKKLILGKITGPPPPFWVPALPWKSLSDDLRIQERCRALKIELTDCVEN